MKAIIEKNITEIVEPFACDVAESCLYNHIKILAETLQHIHLNTEQNEEGFYNFEYCMQVWGGAGEFNDLIFARTDPFETTQYFHSLFAHVNIEFTDQMKGTLQALLIMWRNHIRNIINDD